MEGGSSQRGENGAITNGRNPEIAEK